MLIRTAGRFYRLELTSVDSRHFTQSGTTPKRVSTKDVGMLCTSGTTSYGKGSWAVFNRKCPPFLMRIFYSIGLLT